MSAFPSPLGADVINGRHLMGGSVSSAHIELKGEGGTAVNDRTGRDVPLGLSDGLPIDDRPRHEGAVVGRETIDETELHGVVFAGGGEGLEPIV